MYRSKQLDLFHSQWQHIQHYGIPTKLMQMNIMFDKRFNHTVWMEKLTSAVSIFCNMPNVLKFADTKQLL